MNGPWCFVVDQHESPAEPHQWQAVHGPFPDRDAAAIAADRHRELLLADGYRGVYCTPVQMYSAEVTA